MGENFLKIKETVVTFLSKYTKKQKINVFVGFILILVISTLAILNITKPEYSVLYKDLDIKEAANITKNLDELKIDYKINDEGTILVKKEQINKIKMDLSTKGIPSTKFSYDDLLDKNTMFMSEDEKNKVFNYALQNQIESVIEEMPAIKKADVNLSIPKDSTFILDENKESAKASVVIELNDGFSLNKQSIEGIAFLVSNSVQGLSVDNITIHDSSGRVLNKKENEESYESANQLEIQNKAKEDIENNLVKFLSTIYGNGNVSVMASVKLNFDTDITETKEYNTPIEGEENGLIRSMQEKNESVKNSQNGGVPGTDSNTEEITTYKQEESEDSEYNNFDKTVNYELNEIVRKVEKAKGQIQDITVAVVLNSEILPDKELTDEKKKEIVNTVSSAAGIDTKRVEVYAQSFNNTLNEGADELDTGKLNMPIWTIILIILLILIPICICILYIMKLKKEKEAKKKEEESEDINIMQEEIEELELDIKESGYKKSIENLVNKNPEIVAQLLKSWIDEE
ncbi:flagellar basal-body MS-ring/collar protein FliF [Tepidibacter mesophilus]|uniref:flagellar basal-body MS-ring/collar protein FliF n=1 Tax=Tepidibacter mesophilus TaxID=655607 RepID=UPI000C0780D8|nr:flagellar basal-body MS-ring/collar protein FliF [Tepidibacter mesophilus]